MLLPDSLDVRLIALRSHEDENSSCCSEDFEGLFFHELCTQIIDFFFTQPATSSSSNGLAISILCCGSGLGLIDSDVILRRVFNCSGYIVLSEIGK
jgi:hypothetical protein